MPLTTQNGTHQLFFTQFPEGVLRINASGCILDMNSQAELLLGWNNSELCNTHLHDYLCPQDTEFSHSAESCFFSNKALNKHIDEIYHDAALKKSHIKKFEQWWVKKEGVYLNVDIKLFLIENEETDNELIIIFSDCSQQRFSETEIKRLSLFSELNPAPVLQLDESAVIFYANPAMTDLMVKYGFSDYGFPNIMPINLIHLVKQCTDTHETILNIEQQYNNIWFDWNFHFIEESDTKLVQVYGLDITDRKQNEKHLQELKELAEENSKQKSTFFASMSHELRTPLNGIIGLSHLMQETQLNGIQYDYADKIYKSAESLLMIINDVLDISKIEAGRLDIDPAKFNIRELMYDTISVLEYQAAKKNLYLELRIDPQIPDFLIGDGLRIRQIVLNFLTNAVKFSINGGTVFLNVSCNSLFAETITANDSVNIHFSVTDNGIGIPNDRLDAIFGKYTQVDKSTTRQYGGTGLGLAISRDLAKLMQGFVGAESTLGKGATFWLELPLQQSNNGRTFIEDPLLINKKCLIVAGKPTSCNIIEELLNHWKMTTFLEKNTSTALKIINNFDVIILCDITEKELLQQFSIPNSAFTLAVIKSSDQNQIDLIAAAGIQAYLFKPFLPFNFKQLLHIGLSKEVNKTEILSIYSISQAEQTKTPLAITLKVLLVEDNLINQKIARTMIEKMGCQVDVANDGLDALNLWNENNYDLIFMDCHLPEMDGYECTQHIREKEQNTGQHIPIIALTANTADEEKAHTQAIGMDDFLTKPLQKNKLQELLQTIHDSL
jgi:signal transduction histidine kinase/DNA-binding response OmpR family regulator